MKSFTAEVFIDGRPVLNQTMTGCGFGTIASRAMREAIKTSSLKGKRHKTITARITKIS